MAIFEEKTYGVQCDVCEKVYMNKHSGFSLWTDENSAKEEAQDDYWLIDSGKCYCPDCFDIDDEDNVTIKSKKEVECECTNKNSSGLHEYKEGCRQHCDDCDYYQPIQSKKCKL